MNIKYIVFNGDTDKIEDGYRIFLKENGEQKFLFKVEGDKIIIDYEDRENDC